ncbi:MAG: iron-sulfur cluster-binding domain-containing protein [Clostridia bacterium]|nr:iron-sulfur cluster-binding domain-containing protein [Clostridia bacterium]
MKINGEKLKKIKVSASNFLKILPERVKKIMKAPGSDLKQPASYKPNSLAASLHPDFIFAEVAETRELPGSTVMYTLVPDASRGTSSLAPFAAGQYVSVTAEIDGCVYRRPYSICSSPSEALPARTSLWSGANSPRPFPNGFYRIAVKLQEGGKVSEFIHKTWQKGTKAVISAPEGMFTYEPLRDAPNVVGIAGGVGITPFRSMVKAILEGSEDFSLTLLYGARRESDILFREELDGAAACSEGRIKVVYVLSDEQKEGFEHGFITAETVAKYAPGEYPYSVFAAGPDAMLKSLENELPKLPRPLRRKFVRFDARGVPQDVKAEPDYTAPSQEFYTVKVRNGGAAFEITCGAGETLLSAMERSGVNAPSLCRSGECGFCHTKLISGSYYMPASRDGRRQADSVYGYIHPCCTYPRSDMELDVPVAKTPRA